MRGRVLVLIFCALYVAGAARAQDEETVVLLTHDSFAISEEVLQSFEELSGIQVEILRSGDAGQMVNQAILSKSHPLGDVLYGVDNTFLSRALDAEIFAAYKSPALDGVREEFIPDGPIRATPVDFGDVCLNYDLAYFAEHEIPLPENLRDLTEPDYEGLLVVENAATSSPGLAFLLATIAAFGEAGDFTYLDYWQALADNDVLVVAGWSDAYFGEFTVGSQGVGDRPLVVSYASSPPAEVVYSDDPEAGALTGRDCP